MNTFIIEQRTRMFQRFIKPNTNKDHVLTDKLRSDLEKEIKKNLAVKDILRKAQEHIKVQQNQIDILTKSKEYLLEKVKGLMERPQIITPSLITPSAPLAQLENNTIADVSIIEGIEEIKQDQQNISLFDTVIPAA